MLESKGSRVRMTKSDCLGKALSMISKVTSHAKLVSQK